MLDTIQSFLNQIARVFIITTWWPLFTKALATSLPKKPVAPVSSITCLLIYCMQWYPYLLIQKLLQFCCFYTILMFWLSPLLHPISVSIAVRLQLCWYPVSITLLHVRLYYLREYDNYLYPIPVWLFLLNLLQLNYLLLMAREMIAGNLLQWFLKRLWKKNLLLNLLQECRREILFTFSDVVSAFVSLC